MALISIWDIVAADERIRVKILCCKNIIESTQDL